jgi:hypothetical protein
MPMLINRLKLITETRQPRNAIYYVPEEVMVESIMIEQERNKLRALEREVSGTSSPMLVLGQNTA